MTLAAIGSIVLAPPATGGSAFNLSTTTIVILVIVLVIGLVAVLGFRAPDRSPGMEDKKEHERIDE